MTTGALNSLLSRNVLDIKFNRRRLRSGVPATRRMYCTLSDRILNSVNGRTVLNYLPGGRKLPYNPSSKNLSLVWDVLMQSFRMVPADTVTVIKQLPGDDSFWDFFNENIVSMSQQDKIQFMNS